MQLVKLSEYEGLRRTHSKRRALCTLRREAASGKIPGAFQMDAGGDWWVDLDTHDKIIEERINLQMVEISSAPAPEPIQEDDDMVVSQILKDLGLCPRATA